MNEHPKHEDILLKDKNQRKKFKSVEVNIGSFNWAVSSIGLSKNTEAITEMISVLSLSIVSIIYKSGEL